ncbi:MAG: restriction endonuclease [Chlorobiaceae bacterium]|nr:restriction endonuclease [Chlorobiaceae bacterium]
MELIDYTEKSEVAEGVDGYVHLGTQTDAVEHALLNRHSRNCPFCNTPLETVVHLRVFDEDTGNIPPSRFLWRYPGQVDEFLIDIYTNACGNCGWWQVKNVKNSLGITHYSFPSLRLYDAADKALPLGVLWTELNKRQDLLHAINPTTFEKFVADVVSSKFNVEVVHIGKSGDGGIDLFYCDGNDRFAIQVKRHADSKASEGVAIVREFVGALLLADFQKGAIITTASRFTAPATRDAGLYESKKIVTRLDLVDKEQFIDMFKFSKKHCNHPWEYVFRDVATNYFNHDDVEVIINKSTLL